MKRLETPYCQQCAKPMTKVAYLLPGEGDEMGLDDVILYWACRECDGPDVEIHVWPYVGTVSIAQLVKDGFDVIS